VRCRLCRREIEPGYVDGKCRIVYVTKFGQSMECRLDRHSVPSHELDTVELARELTQVLFA
jgi:hypothetical protein